MAIHLGGLRRTYHAQASALDERLAALPAGTIVAVYDGRLDAAGLAVQLKVDDPDRQVWLRSDEAAAASIRNARSARPIALRLLRGFGDEETQVREVMRQAEAGRTLLVFASDGRATDLSRLQDASHIYQFGLWTIRFIR